MKHVFEPEDNFELAALQDAVKNKRKVDQFYDRVLRPFVKYRDLSEEEQNIVDEIVESAMNFLTKEESGCI